MIGYKHTHKHTHSHRGCKVFLNMVTPNPKTHLSQTYQKYSRSHSLSLSLSLFFSLQHKHKSDKKTLSYNNTNHIVNVTNPARIQFVQIFTTFDSFSIAIHNFLHLLFRIITYSILYTAAVPKFSIPPTPSRLQQHLPHVHLRHCHRLLQQQQHRQQFHYYSR